MGIPKIDLSPMTVEDFFSFTDSRPDDERWELIDGEPFLNATPSFLHQRIAGNIHSYLLVRTDERPCTWTVTPGIGVRVSDTKLPVPDVLVHPDSLPGGNNRECDDMIVAFEVLSPSTSDLDLKWKRAAYTNLPSLTHYVIVGQDALDVVVFARENGFDECRYKSLRDVIDFPLLDVTLPLSAIYRRVPFA